MKHIIIGTAGHIDHGKTTLIRALTGRNTDRLQEEQKRGITIELGFTWFDMKDGTRCGIIDVPGHEKFVGNMVSGVVGMDLVIMVVAADEGIMPQTVEHLDILELLGIQKTILVLNKCDLVDEEWLELMEEETREKLQGTIMEHAPIVRVSASTGGGHRRAEGCHPQHGEKRGGGEGCEQHSETAHRPGIYHLRLRHHRHGNADLRYHQ